MFKYNNYDIVARVRKQEVVYYKEFGYYSGDWVCIARDRINYYIYKSWFGSCAGCDPLQMKNPITKDQAIEFVNSSEEYAPFLIIPRQKMKLICQSKNFKTIFPRNFRYSFSETINFKNFFSEIGLIIKSYEGIIKAKEILKIKNIEERRNAIKRYGEEKFMSEIGGKIIDKEEGNYLIRIKMKPEDFVYLNLKDSSTGRRYFLRVPPDTKKVKEGIAWSFGLKVDEYKLEAET